LVGNFERRFDIEAGSLDNLGGDRFELADIRGELSIELPVGSLLKEPRVHFPNDGHLGYVDITLCRSTLRLLPPSPEKVLHEMIHSSKTFELAEVSEIHHLMTGASLHEDECGDRPVDQVIPKDFDRHDRWVAEETVLVLISGGCTVVKPLKDPVVGKRAYPDASPGEFASNEICQKSVGEGNEIAAWRVKGIMEKTRFPSDSPAIRGEDLFAFGRVVFDRQEVSSQAIAFSKELKSDSE